MSLDAILEAIRQSGLDSVRAIEERTRDDIARIMADGESEADHSQREAHQAASSATAADQARIIHHAGMEAMQIVGNAEQMIVEQALEQVKLRLATLRAEPDYPEFLRRLLQEALALLQGSLLENEQAHLFADPHDRALLEQLLRELQLTVPVSYELESWGGVRATSADRRVVVDNTLEARLTFATPTLRQFLPTLLKRNPETGSALHGVDKQPLNA